MNCLQITFAYTWKTLKTTNTHTYAHTKTIRINKFSKVTGYKILPCAHDSVGTSTRTTKRGELIWEICLPGPLLIILPRDGK